ncbi:Cbb3-type cytochrome c oxidase subunit CcoP2 [Pirellulimonas nuda]|uniref:Cbb3-type cytochrome c oxidase subunit CcoP2 n=1 Tax=Pirellulimonas nuda TaxID=2528009 RepID=A0A518DHS7_9BACT|nr:cbb3-type cytochrome c oxidase N-terminal domain-containing protein [Pirellulimonas nuda]QDU91026.1 Cbb3-type cytochrome c oxidase subunit CcoP2 [Pirellulimonas nuda]
MAAPDQPADDPLTGHSYDGIQEYDNPTPGWWNAIFIGTILFAPVYAIWFHSANASNTVADSYQSALAANMRLQFGEIGTLEPDEATILTYMNKPDWLKVGAVTFASNCASCHGREGEGVSGPNMTDDRYLNVKTIEDIAKVIREGAKNGAMPAWGNRLHPNEVVLAAAYVASLRGKNLPSARLAEGNEIPPWPAAPVAAESN